MTRLLTLLLAATAASTALADVKLPAIIGDNMVLQRGKPLMFWGTADPGEGVSIEIKQTTANSGAAQGAASPADEHGNWKFKLSPLKHAGPVAVTIKGAKNSITLKNVLVGEVWVCSGQSNMEWSVNRSNNPKDEIANAKYPKIRLFKAKKVVKGEPTEDTEGQWVECSPETIPGFTAVGYFFGRALHKKLDVPVGLIQSAWGGTPAEAWTSLPTLKSKDALVPIVKRWDDIIGNAEKFQAQYQQRLKAWQVAAKKARAEGKRPPRRPRPPVGPTHPHRAAGLYNGMIVPIAPYAIAGAIWYQGESNAGRAYQYRTLFPTMITDWRKLWGQGDFPFLFVQLANFRQRADQPGDSSWAELREAQTKTLSLPNTGMAVIIDIGEANDIHPRNKQDVGKRLALQARKIAYGEEDLTASGPIYKSMKIDGNKIRLSFDSVGEGLVARGGELKGFAVAGKEQKFVWARAKIDGDEIVVWSDEVAEPVAVRYAWADNPVATLYNKDGLPASPFRTDERKGVTAGNR